MTRTTVILLLCLLVGTEVSAQDRPSYGLKLGITAARQSIDGETFGERWLGPNVGFFADVPVRGSLGILGEVAYEQKGTRFDRYIDVINGSTGEDVRFRYHYASTLVAARFRHPLSGGRILPFAYAGPRLDVLVRERVTAEEGDLMNEIREASRFVVGARAGLGAELYGVIGFPVVLEIRYDRGLSPAVEVQAPGPGGASGGELVNEFGYNSIGVRIGVLF